MSSRIKYLHALEVARAKGFICPYDGKPCLRRMNGEDCFIPEDKEFPEHFPAWYCYRYKGAPK
jgi:hypothetical protein